MFVVAQSQLLRVVPFKHSERLVVLENAGGTYVGERSQHRAPDIIDWKQQSKVFGAVASFAQGGANLSEAVAPRRLNVALVAGDFFRVLQVPPEVGQPLYSFGPSSDSPRNVVISDELWRGQFGGDPVIVGRQISLNGRRYVVDGVMPRGVTFPRHTDVWLPLSVPFDFSQTEFFRTALQETVIARLQPQISIGQAQALVNSLVMRLSVGQPDAVGADNVHVIPLRDELAARYKTVILLLCSTAVLILLIAIGSVSSLTLASTITRSDELRLRLALGASQSQLALLVMYEPLIIALSGGALGILLATSSTRLLRGSGLFSLATPLTAVDAQFAAMCLMLSLACGVLSGLGSVVVVADLARRPSIRPNAHVLAAGGGVRKSILAAQVSLAFVLLSTAALTTESLSRLLSEDAGFSHASSASLLTADVSLPTAPYPTAESRAAFVAQLLDALQHSPGVAASGVVSDLPLSGYDVVNLPVAVQSASSQKQEAQVEREVVSPAYFRTLGLPIMRGRSFTEMDLPGSQLVAIVNDQFARRFWPDGNAIGGHIAMPFASQSYTVVGVAGDVRARSLDKGPGLQLYVPFAQQPTTYFSIVVLGRGDELSLITAIRRSIGALDRTLPVYGIKTMAQVRTDATARSRAQAAVLGLFGVIAVVLATVGVYGMTAFLVARRTSEIGLRRALGAPATSVFQLVAREALRPVLAGIALGVLGALVTSNLFRAVVFGVGPRDPITLAATGFFLLVAAIVAIAAPAARAIRIDPLIAIRQDGR